MSRNFAEYPVTVEEIVECLKQFQESVSYEKTGLIGDMRPYLLELAIDVVMKREKIDQEEK